MQEHVTACWFLALLTLHKLLKIALLGRRCCWKRQWGQCCALGITPCHIWRAQAHTFNPTLRSQKVLGQLLPRH